MVVYDARPSPFTQLTTIGEWEYMASALQGGQDGIDPDIGSVMVPSLDSPGRNAVIADGSALIKGQLWRCDAPVSTAVPAASAQNRIDRLVLRLNRAASTSPTVVQPVIITGTPSGSPAIPSITQTLTGIWDLPISRWTSTSAGAISTLVDERQFCTVVRSAYKTSNTTRSNNITLTADPQLSVLLDANAVYKLEGLFLYAADAASDVILGFITSPTVTGTWAGYGPGTTIVTHTAGTAVATDVTSSHGYMLRSEYTDITATRTYGGTVNTDPYAVIVRGTVLTGSQIGSFALAWSQAVASATATSVQAQSFIELRRIV